LIALTLLLGALLAIGGECPVLLDKARQAYQARDFESAIAAFERARTVCPEPARLLLPLAQAQVMGLRLEAGLGTLAELLRAEPSHTDALKLKGDVLYLLGRETEAEQALQAALRIDPDHHGSRYALGRMYYQQSNLKDATETFEHLVRRDPKDYRAHDNLGLCYAAQQRDAEALRHFLEALDLVHEDHPEYDAVYANTAEFFLERNQFEKAFQLAAEAAQRNANSARNFYLTGKALVKLEKPELALKWLRQAAALDPTHRETRYWLAQVYRRQGQAEDARRELQAFEELAKKPRPR
jgi:protein O-GlcNAc transferase